MRRIGVTIVLVFFVLLGGSMPVVHAAKNCTVTSLRTLLIKKRGAGEDLSNLPKRAWWNRCSLSTRRIVFREISSIEGNTLPVLGMATELKALGTWFNADPLSMASLKGKVVLLHFWTYGCINCIRSLPIVQRVWETYRDQPFTILGIHTPEFVFEKSKERLQSAIEKHGLTYPIVQDNEYANWNAYKNRYWPTFILIDALGNVRAVEPGEQDEKTLTRGIETLLSEVQ